MEEKRKKLLEIKDLTVQYHTVDRIVHAAEDETCCHAEFSVRSAAMAFDFIESPEKLSQERKDFEREREQLLQPDSIS